jgi:rubrerythrin
MQITNIATGFLNLAKKHLNIANEKVEKVAIWRYSKCLQCVEQDKTFLTCNICDCSTPAKVRVNEEKCPIGKW